MMYGDHGDGGGWGWGAWLLMALTMLTFLALVGFGVFMVWRSTSHPRQPEFEESASPPRAAESILAERMARGEIEPEEYRRRLDALKPGSS